MPLKKVKLTKNTFKFVSVAPPKRKKASTPKRKTTSTPRRRK